jgi:hypothetical protein
MEASNEFRRRELTLLAIFAAKGPAAIEFHCGDAAMTEKSYQPSRESGECRFRGMFRSRLSCNFAEQLKGVLSGTI